MQKEAGHIPKDMILGNPILRCRHASLKNFSKEQLFQWQHPKEVAHTSLPEMGQKSKKVAGAKALKPKCRNPGFFMQKDSCAEESNQALLELNRFLTILCSCTRMCGA